jgi:hypothetical protein
MTNPSLSATDPMQGSFALAVSFRSRCADHLLAWLAAGPLVEFTDVILGCLFEERGFAERAGDAQPGGARCVSRGRFQRAVRLPSLFCWPGTFLIAHPSGVDGDSPPGEGQTMIGNHYATRFQDAWEAGRVHGDESAVTREADSNLCGRLRRQHPARRRQGGGQRKPLHPGDDDLLSNGRWRVSRALRGPTTIAAVALGTAPTCGITRQPRPFCFPRLRGRCVKRLLDTAWMTRAACVFASCFPMARRDTT